MDKIYLDALKLIINEEEVSCVFLQLKLSIGYEIAYDILEQMEKEGYVSALNEKTYERKVLITKEQLEKFV